MTTSQRLAAIVDPGTAGDGRGKEVSATVTWVVVQGKRQQKERRGRERERRGREIERGEREGGREGGREKGGEGERERGVREGER